MSARARKVLDENEDGFTLIELLVVIVIIGILAAIAIPVFLNQRKKGVDASLKSDLKNAATQMETYLVDYQSYGTTGAAGTASALTGGYRPSPNNTVTVVSVAASGYCLTATNPNGSNVGGFYYDSANGGLTATVITGNGTGTGFGSGNGGGSGNGVGNGAVVGATPCG